MTLLLTSCPYCSSNFMLLNTEGLSGECVVCNRMKKFTEAEVSEAESTRDRLAEMYQGRLEKAYRNRDHKAMADLVEEVANSGISSWYAWFCVGWSDLHAGRTPYAFDDFKLAAQFLDEENFDEFYELTMDAVLESIEEKARAGEDWMQEDTSIVEFTSVLFQRFEHLCEDGDFMCDLMLRLGTLSEQVDSAAMGGSILKEIMMIVMDYMSGHPYGPDRETLLNNAQHSIREIDEVVQTMAQDGTIPPNVIKIWGPGFVEYLQILIDSCDRMTQEYSEEDLFLLCDYWGVNDYGSVFDVLQDSFQFHMGYILSGKRNKGSLKKRDKALADYDAAFKRPLVEGLTPESDSFEEEYDRICPDCGQPLTADENGLMVCECGFRSRAVTAAIEDLPENVPELIMMGRKAYLEKDPVMLNNIGERILEFDGDNWYGHLTLASACAIDKEMGEALMFFVQAAEHLNPADRKEYRDRVLDDLTMLISSSTEEGQEASIMFVPMLYETVSQSPAKDCGIPMALMDRLIQLDYDNSLKSLSVLMTITPTLIFEMTYNTSLRYHSEVIGKLSRLTEAIQKGNSAIAQDESNLKDDVNNLSKSLNDLLTYMGQGIDVRIAGMSDERIGYLSGYWSANVKDYDDLLCGIVSAFAVPDDITYSPKSKFIRKSKHAIDRYLDDFIEPVRQ